MDFENFTERSKGFIQAAQMVAVNRRHQALQPEHLLKALLDDREGMAAGLITAAGGDPAKAIAAVDADLEKIPRSMHKAAPTNCACRRNSRACCRQSATLPKKPATAMSRSNVCC